MTERGRGANLHRRPLVCLPMLYVGCRGFIYLLRSITRVPSFVDSAILALPGGLLHPSPVSPEYLYRYLGMKERVCPCMHV